MRNFVLRKFSKFNALEVDCSDCNQLCSLSNSNCINCINKLRLDFDLLELKKRFSSIYYDNGLSSSLRGTGYIPLDPFIVPSFINFYLVPIGSPGSASNFSIKNSVFMFNPLEYNLSPEDLELFDSLVRQVQDEEISVEELSLKIPSSKFYLKKLVLSYTKGLGLFDELLSINELQDLFVNSPGNDCVFFNHDSLGQLSSNIFLKSEMSNKMSTFFRTRSGRPFDEAFPVLHTSLSDGNVRVCGVNYPLSFDGIGFAIRKHPVNPFTLHKLVFDGFMSSEVAGLLWFLLDAELSVLVTGPRGSGKTSLLGGLLFNLSSNNRFIIIEDTNELPVNHVKGLGFNVEHLRTSSFENSDSFEFSSDTALRTALRLGESVLVVGEVRGPETKVLFEAMRVGATGNCVMGTIHGSSAFDTFDRIVNDLGVPPTSFKATDVVLSCSYLKKGNCKERRLVSVTEVGKDWVSNPGLEKGFTELVSYNTRTKRYSFGKLSSSALIKRVADSFGLTVNKCIKDIELRGKVIDLVVSLARKKGDSSLLVPESIVKQNNLFHSLIGKDSRLVLNEFRKAMGLFNISGDDKKNVLVIDVLFSLKAFSKGSAVPSKELFNKLNGKLSRSSFNSCLNFLESNNSVKCVTIGDSLKWYLSKDTFKFLNS